MRGVDTFRPPVTMTSPHLAGCPFPGGVVVTDNDRTLLASKSSIRCATAANMVQRTSFRQVPVRVHSAVESRVLGLTAQLRRCPVQCSAINNLQQAIYESADLEGFLASDVIEKMMVGRISVGSKNSAQNMRVAFLLILIIADHKG